MTLLNGQHVRRLPWLTLTIAGAVAMIHAMPELAAALTLRADDLATGQVWRLMTGHVAHWSGEHLLWDVLAFVALGVLGERMGRGWFIGVMAVAAIAIGLWFCAGQAALTHYRGLSGVDSALFVYVAVRYLAMGVRGRQWRLAGAAGLAVVMFVGKTVAEVLAGQPVFVGGGGFEPVVEAHLIGAGAGLMGAAACAAAQVVRCGGGRCYSSRAAMKALAWAMAVSISRTRASTLSSTFWSSTSRPAMALALRLCLRKRT